MTTAHKLKKAIRARARKTGESYAAARRQLLKLVPPTPSPAPATTRGGLSEKTALARTGHGLAHWFAVLDRFSRGRQDHTAAARHLRDAHGVPGWHAQGITVAWERARGHRAASQACTGGFQVSVSRVVPADLRGLTRALTDRARRRAWLQDADPGLARALAAALDGATPKLKQGDARARLRFRWDGCPIELRLDAKPGGRASIVADNTGLPDASTVEKRRAAWRDALDALRAHLGA